MTAAFTESVVEQAALAWLGSVGWQVRNGAAIAPGDPAAERDDYGQVVLAQRLCDALARLNPALPAEALLDAFRKLTRPEGAELIVRNRALHRLLVDGDGYARHMRDALPHASFIGFTGTPIELQDASTRGLRRLHPSRRARSAGTSRTAPHRR